MKPRSRKPMDLGKSLLWPTAKSSEPSGRFAKERSIRSNWSVFMRRRSFCTGDA
nr:MAG TPA: hypothetical protein [Caudoviricetes sp.]